MYTDTRTDSAPPAAHKGAPELRCYTIADIQSILNISRNTAYALLKRNEFRWIKVGRCYRISKESFDEWLRNG